MASATIQRADWDLWGKIPEVYLWEAICLSMNLEPDGNQELGLRIGNWKSGPPFFFSSAEFRKRLLIAQRGFRSSTNLHLESPKPDDDAWRPVSLIEFGAWATANGGQLPDRFPIVRGEDDGNDARKVSRREQTSYLNIVGGLLGLMMGKSPAGKAQSVYASQAAIISALLAHYGGKPGISKTTLEAKFAEAKRVLGAT